MIHVSQQYIVEEVNFRMKRWSNNIMVDQKIYECAGNGSGQGEVINEEQHDELILINQQVASA